MKKSEILSLIKEEVELVLTNNEVIEFFDIDAGSLLDEMMLGEQEGGSVDVKGLGKERETASSRRKRLRGAAAGGSKEITPQESGMLKMILGVLEAIAKEDNLVKYRPILLPLLKKLQQRSKTGAQAGEPGGGEQLAEEDKWIQGAHLKKGRCTPMGTPECPEGSPQYNLAKRFKSGDIHKANLKKGKNPHGPG